MMSTTTPAEWIESQETVTPPGQRLGLLRFLVALQAVTLPVLGIPTFFRNEASWHYNLWQKTSFLGLFDGFLTSRSAMSNAVVSRPFVRILEWLQVRLFGLHASWYVAVNGAFFVGFALALFELGVRVAGATTGVLAVLLLVGFYPIVFYPVLNAIHGVQYPVEMLLCTASLVCFLDAFAGQRRRAWLGVVLAILAFVSHAASALVIPLAVATMWMAQSALPLGRRLRWALLSALGVGCAFAIERQGVPGGLTSQSGLEAKLAFAWGQLQALGMLVLKPPGGPILLWALVWDAARRTMPARFRGRVGVLVALVVALLLAVAARRFPGAVLVLFALTIVLAVAPTPQRWYLATWAAVGMLVFVATPEKNASYTRHFLVPCLVLAASALEAMLEATFRVPTEGFGLRARYARLVLSAVATLGLWIAILVAWRGGVPVLSARIEQVRYVGDLGINFHELLDTVLPEVQPGGTLAFFAGRSREEEMRSLYGEDYFQRLQPAKADHYDDFVALLGRPDVHIAFVDPVSGPMPTSIWLVAVNAWEMDRAQALCGCPPHRLVSRGKARAGFFRSPGS